ncbi:hypothetical protein [Streptomyces sp. URMC 125]|uniref:hypothetical protein n=1 Tax=Streptomyces sp. URMC 125 TaxID=3423419 RepID=UPI003F1E1B44
MSTDLYETGAADANLTRAHWALAGLEAFASRTGQASMLDGTANIPDDIFMEIAGDFLADLFHLARLNGIDPDSLVGRAREHFEAEVSEEIEEAKEESAVCSHCGEDMGIPVSDYKGDGICKPCHVHEIGDMDSEECDCTECETARREAFRAEARQILAQIDRMNNGGCCMGGES